MNADLSKTLYAGLFFLCIFISGFWLSRAGKPFNVALLTVHKLLSLAAFIFLAIILYRTQQSVGLSAAAWGAGIAAGMLFVSLIATGGLLSTGKMLPAIVLKIHQIAPYLTVLATAITLYLLANHKV